MFFDLNQAVSQKFAKNMGEKLGLAVKSMENVEEAVVDADIISTVTTAEVPIVKGQWLKKGCHINAVGAHTSNSREFDDDAIKRCKIIVDSRVSALREAGEIILPLNKGIITESAIVSEIGDIILGNKRGRISSSEITFFKSVGLAVQDAAAAKIVYEKARKLGVGTQVDLLR